MSEKTRPRDDEDFVGCSDCMVPLVMTFERPGKEFKCPKCGRFTEFFDGYHVRQKWGQFSPAAQETWIAAMASKQPVPAKAVPK